MPGVHATRPSRFANTFISESANATIAGLGAAAGALGVGAALNRCRALHIPAASLNGRAATLDA